MSTYKRYQYTIKITLHAPLLSQASGGISYGLDASMLRNKGNTPALPSTLIRGNLSHNWQEFIKLGSDELKQKSKQWLGDAPSKNQQYNPERGELYFDEYWYWTANKQGEKDIIHRIKIDEATGTVKKGAYLVVESPWKSGDEVEFSGDAQIFLSDEQEAENLKKWLYKGLIHSTALGAYKGIGFGRIKSVSVEYEEKDKKPLNISNNRFSIKIKPNKAFCLSQHQRGNNSAELSATNHHRQNDHDKTGLDNHFTSEEYISGAAIKGAIATWLRKYGGNKDISKAIENPAYPMLSEYLDQIHISHAQAQDQNKDYRPSIPPISLVASADDTLYDIITKDDKAGLIDKTAPLFMTDWKSKHWKQLKSECNAPAKPERRLSIHTAIEKGSDAAAEGQLYSIDAVVPDGHIWLANITLPEELEAEQQTQLQNELATLLAQGLYGIGKTAATATVTLANNDYQHPCHKAIDDLQTGDSVIITLQSPSKLLADDDIQRLAPSNDGETLLELYKDAFKDTGLELIKFYADHQLIGGYYWHKRYNKGKAYNPQLFTKAGSVFRFTITELNTAKTTLKEWQRLGIASDNENWQENPYNRSNGYGEVAINLPIHWDREPTKSKDNWEAIA